MVAIHRPNQLGFSIVEVSILLIGILIICSTGWYVWNAKKSATTSLDRATTTNTAAPAATKTADKNSSTTQPGTAANTETSTATAAKTLKINELKLQVALSAETADAYYDKITEPSTGNINYYISTHSLDKYNDCKPNKGGLVAISSFKPGDVDEMVGNYDQSYPDAPLINGQRYFIQGNQYDCTGGADTKLYTDTRTSLYKSKVTAIE
jgi:hypothetical protein